MTEQLVHASLWILAQAWAAGAVLGALFFGGLWLTVHRLLLTGRPALWVLGSFLLRSGVALIGFYLVAGGGWQRLLACLLGFVMARQWLARLTRSRGDAAASVRQTQKETLHAP
ncbi:N-ATPase, AtpR subunit [mine drainage metagenome]|uniref:N-ATPase, AtpR subunit n=1 Tax=mine drainage metagenome TaxID=410659 RepID=A0A1J5Q8D2_9ZZZZ